MGTTVLEHAVESALATRVVESLFVRTRLETPSFVGSNNRYRIVELVGGGSSGHVFRAIDTRFSDDNHEEIVAVKILRGDSSEDEALKARYVRHRNVVQSLDYGDGFVVFQFVEGGSLADTCRPVGARQAAQTIACVADGVQSAHNQGLIHRDLKPGNVLLTEGGIPKVADFGISVRDAELDRLASESSPPSGNMAFMAPELLSEGRIATSVQSDVYALSAMLYWLLTDRLPHGRSIEEIQSNLATGQEVDFNGINPDLARICQRGMARSLSVRYQSAHQLAEDLRRFARHLPLEWTHPPLTRRAQLFWRRDKRLALASLAAIAALLASAGAVGWFYEGYREAEVADAERIADVDDALQKAHGLLTIFETFSDGLAKRAQQRTEPGPPSSVEQSASDEEP